MINESPILLNPLLNTGSTTCRTLNLSQELLFHLRDFRITLKRYGIEVLYEPLPKVYADPERVDRFFRTAIGQVVQFSRDGQLVVYIDARARENGIDLVITARRRDTARLLIIGHFAESGFERA